MRSCCICELYSVCNRCMLLKHTVVVVAAAAVAVVVALYQVRFSDGNCSQLSLAFHNSIMCATWMVACLLQDGFMERLTSNEFVCLSQSIDGFVTSTEQISGRRCTTLRTTVQNQVRNGWCRRVQTDVTATILSLWYRSTCVSWHPGLRIRGFCWSKVLLLECHCFWLREKLPLIVLPALSLYHP